MLGFDNHCCTASACLLNQCGGNLVGQVLLYLQTPCIHINDACNLRETDHFAFRQVGDVALADKRQHVMLAHRIQLNILHNNHFVVVRFEHSAIDDIVDVQLIAVGQEGEGLGRAIRCVYESVPFRILPNSLK